VEKGLSAGKEPCDLFQCSSEEAELFKQRCESLVNILVHSPEELSQQLCMLLLSESNEQMRQTIVSLGQPILEKAQ
jgi:hypothetical protein